MPNPTALTPEQKRALYHNGFVIVRNAVPPAMVQAARARIAAAAPGERLAEAREMTDLVNASSVTPILNEAMGPFDPPSTCQVAVTPVGPLSDRYVSIGYRERDLPYYGVRMHMDGAITIAPPQEPQQGAPEEVYARYFASGPSGNLGRSAAVMGTNGTPLFQDPEMTLGLGSFTAFVFACLNDQTREGCGQTVVLPGAHHAMEAYFRQQRRINNHLGPEGPGWPRLDHTAPNRCGLVYLPPSVQEAFTDATAETTPDGRKWPRPTQVLMNPGDVCIAMYHIPHSPSVNVNGTESRKNIIFRIRNKNRQPNITVTGGSDHPDRGWKGEFLTYEPGNNLWERSKDAMCDMWNEWQGMQDTVREARAHAA